MYEYSTKHLGIKYSLCGFGLDRTPTSCTSVPSLVGALSSRRASPYVVYVCNREKGVAGQVRLVFVGPSGCRSGDCVTGCRVSCEATLAVISN